MNLQRISTWISNCLPTNLPGVTDFFLARYGQRKLDNIAYHLSWYGKLISIQLLIYTPSSYGATTPEWLFSCWTLQYVHLLVSDYVRLSGFLELFQWEQLLVVTKNDATRAMRVNVSKWLREAFQKWFRFYSKKGNSVLERLLIFGQISGIC